MYWFKDDDFEQLMFFNRTDILQKIDNYKRIPAYTLQDILEKIPNAIQTNIKETGIEYTVFSEILSRFLLKDDLLNTAYDMLVWCIENNYIKTK